MATSLRIKRESSSTRGEGRELQPVVTDSNGIRAATLGARKIRDG